jgi:hypothetical protein
MQLRVKPTLLAGMKLTIGAAGVTEPFSEILTPKAAYVKLPVAGSPSRPWIRLSLTKGSAAGAAFGQLLQSIETSNPQNRTEMLTASKDLRKTGTQITNGIPRTRYTGSYPIGAALRRLPAGLRRQSGSAVRSLGVSSSREDYSVPDVAECSYCGESKRVTAQFCLSCGTRIKGQSLDLLVANCPPPGGSADPAWNTPIPPAGDQHPAGEAETQLARRFWPPPPRYWALAAAALAVSALASAPWR